MMSEIKFSDGIEKIKEDYNKIIYPEELLEKMRWVRKMRKKK